MVNNSSTTNDKSQSKGVTGYHINPVPPPVSATTVQQGGKTIDVPKPTILIDTREQEGHHYDFERFPNWIAGTQRQCLKTGDYTVKGLEAKITIERKTLEDLVGTLTANRKTFIRECQRMEHFHRKVIVIETTLARLKSRYAHSDAHPNAIFGTLVAIQERFGIQTMFAATRELAEEFTASTLCKYHTLHWLQENGYQRCFIEGDI